MGGLLELILGVAACVAPQQGPRVVGEPALLDALRVAQRANLARYPAGKMKVAIRSGDPENQSHQQRLKAAVTWGLGSYRFDGTYQNASTTTAGEPKAAPEDDLSVIEVADRFTYLNRRIGYLQIARPGKLTLPMGRLEPAAKWYHMLGKSWSDLLTTGGPTAGERVEQYRVESIGDDRCRLDVRWPTGATLEATFSLGQDGNALDFEGSDPAASQRLSGTYQWERDARGRLFLKRSESLFEFRSPSAGKVVRVEVLEVEELDLDYVPKTGDFRIDLASLERGTRVKDEIANRSYEVGTAPTVEVVDQLDGLADRLKKDGLARPDRP